MLNRLALTMGAITTAIAVSSAWSAGPEPYTDPGLLAMPWGNFSFVRQAWRGYADTEPAVRYVDGLGVVWNRDPPGKSAAQTAQELAWAGFHRVRIEIPWGAVQWDERGFDAATEQRLASLLPALRRYGLRPLVLLNANHGQPCPVRTLNVRVAAPAAAGARALSLAHAVSGGLGSLPTTIATLADGSTAGPLVESYRETGDGAVIGISKPLSRPVREGEALQLMVLKYAPLQDPGTQQFERTAAGWIRYVRLVARTMELLYGSDNYDVEIWNELTFGSAFLDAGNYTEAREAAGAQPDSMQPGGRVWQLANLTTQALKSGHPQVQVIWGFSNTTWFHTPVTDLPPGTDGQSYHPYGTGKRCYVDMVEGRFDLLLEKFIPDGCSIQPEGYAHTWQQTESLMRLIQPSQRAVRPPQSPGFSHYITEHGLRPFAIGIRDGAGARLAKRKFLQRAPLFWLNKGVSALYVYDVYEDSDLDFGLFNADGSTSPAMTALHNLRAQFAHAMPVASVRELRFTVRAVGTDPGVLPGDPDGRYLRRSQVVALLPFQLDDHRFLIGAYVMTQDFPHDLPAAAWRITISGLDAAHADIALYLPESDELRPVKAAGRSADTVVVDVPLTDVPRLIEIGERAAT